MKRVIEKTKHKGIICATTFEALLAVKKVVLHLISSDFNLKDYSDGDDLAASICQLINKKIPCYYHEQPIGDYSKRER